MSGTVSYHAGVAAEEAVERWYVKAGHIAVARRWRGAGGEIDLIVQHNDETIFVEVKKADSHALAAARLSERQIRRLRTTATEFMGTLPRGLLSPVRFDVATVDQQGCVAVIENAF